MKKLKQSQIAKELGISKSYLSMILSGQRKCPPELMGKLQSIPGVHKVVNNELWDSLYTQEVRGSSPLLPTISLVHLALKPGDPLFNSLTCSTRDLENFYLFVYPLDYLGKDRGIKLEIR